MLIHTLKTILATSVFTLAVLTSTQTMALSPWLKHQNNSNIPNSRFFSLATADLKTGRIVALENPKPMAAFAIGQQGLNPVETLLDAYKDVLGQAGKNPANSTAYVRVQGSVVYTSAKYTRNIDLALCNTATDMPLEILYPTLKNTLQTRIKNFFKAKNTNVDVFVPPARTLETPDYINMSVKITNKNGTTNNVELNITMPDYAGGALMEQKSILQLRCFFNLDGKCPHPDIIDNKTLYVENVSQNAIAYFTGIKREYIGYMRYLEANGMDMPRGQLLLFAGKYLAFLLADGQWENFKLYKNNQMNVPMANRKVQAFLATKFRVKAIEKLLEASRLTDNQRGIKMCEQMLKNGIFDKNRLEDLALEIFTETGSRKAKNCAQQKFIVYTDHKTALSAA